MRPLVVQLRSNIPISATNEMGGEIDRPKVF